MCVRLAAPRDVRGFVETALELAAVHEAGERVVGRLVRHLPVQAAQLGDVVQQDDRANELAVVIAQRRRGELDGALLPRGLAEQHRAATQIVRLPLPPPIASLTGSRQQLAVVLVDRARRSPRAAGRSPATASTAEQLFRGRIEVHEVARRGRWSRSASPSDCMREHLQRRRRGRRRRQRRRDQRGARGGFLLVDLAARERAQLLASGSPRRRSPAAPASPRSRSAR